MSIWATYRRTANGWTYVPGSGRKTYASAEQFYRRFLALHPEQECCISTVQS